MEEGAMQQGTWAGELQPPQAQPHVQYMDIQQYPQDPSYPAAAVPQQQQCFDTGSGFQAGQSPQVPQLHGFAGAFQQPTIPGMVVPPAPPASGPMFMSTNIQSLPGSMPMGDMVNQPNLHPVQLDHQSPMVYPLEPTHHQNGWQDPRPRQRRRRIQPQQQRKQQRHQQRPQQHQQHRQKPRQQKQQAGHEGVEVAISSSLPGICVDSSDTMRKNKLMYDRMSPGGASLDLSKFQQRNPDKWATSAAFELCKIMKPSTRPTYKIDGGPSKLNPPFTVAVSVNGVEYTPATAHSVKLAKQLASLNFVRELIGNRPNNVNIEGLKTGNVPIDGFGAGEGIQQQQQLSSHTAAALEMDAEVGLCSSLTPASVSSKAVATAAPGKGGGKGSRAGTGRAGVGGDGCAISGEDKMEDSGPSIKNEISKSVDNPPVAPGPVGNSLEYDRMHPGGVELRNLRNLKTKDRPAVSTAYGLCNMMVPPTRPEFCFLGNNSGSGPFTMFIEVNGVKYTPATGSSIKIARSEASINFIREVVGDRVKLDLDGFSPPSAVSGAESKGKTRVKQKGDDKEGSLNFLKLLHDLVTALPRTDSYTVFEWIPLEAASTKKKGGKESAQRFCCVARLKLRVEDDEEGHKRLEEIKAAKLLFHSSEAKLSESPDDLTAMENWKSAQEKLTALKAMPAAKIDILKTSGEGLHKKDAKVVAARAMLYKLLPECKDNRELYLKAKSIIDQHWEEEAKAAGAMAGTGDEECVGKRKRLETTDSLSAIKDKQGEGWTILRAALNNKGDDIDRLVAAGAIVPKTKKFWKGKSLLHLAAEKGCLDATSSLIRHGLDVDIRDKQGRTCLHLAAERGHLPVVRALLAAGADVHVRHGQRDCSAMDEAVCKGHVEIVDAIIRAGADPGAGDCTGYRALHRAAYEDRSEVVEALLDRGVDVDPRDDDDSTPVHFAAQQGSVSALGVMLRRGADPNALDRNRDSPLHLAGLYLDDEARLLGVVEALLRWGADEEALNGEDKKVTDLVVNSRVLGVLKRAPAERKVRRDGNWGRRRLVVLCRSRVVGEGGLGEGKVKEEAAASGVVERVVKVKEQKIFRSFVGFL